VDEPDGLDVARLRSLAAEGVVEQPGDPALLDGAASQHQSAVVSWRGGRRRGGRPGHRGEPESLTPPLDLGLALGGQAAGELAQRLLGRAAQERVDAVADDLAAQRQQCCLVGGEGERRQEVAFDETVALAGRRGDWHAGLAERFDVAVDGPNADLEGLGEVLGPKLAPDLKLQQDAHQPVGTVHRGGGERFIGQSCCCCCCEKPRFRLRGRPSPG
jgi:hypothetical protein